MESLPSEILFEIIGSSRPTCKDLLACSLVSRSWNALTLPYLFHSLHVRMVPFDEQVPPAKRTYPQRQKIETLLTLYTFLMLSPHICNHVRHLQLTIAPPSDLNGNKPRRSLDITYGVDPQSFLAVLSCLPKLQEFQAKGIFLSRPLLPEELCAGPADMISLELDFPAPMPDRWEYGLDMLEIIYIFPTCRKLILSGPRIKEDSAQKSIYANQSLPSEALALFMDSESPPERMWRSLLPSSSLTQLVLGAATMSTLAWLPSVLVNLNHTLERFVCTFASQTTLGSPDHSAFEFLYDLTFPKLRTLAFFFLDTLTTKGTANNIWKATHHLLRTISRLRYPSLEVINLVIFTALDGAYFEIPTEPESDMHSVDEALMGALCQGRFTELNIGLDVDEEDGFEPSNLDEYKQHISRMFPQIHQRGVLSFRVSREAIDDLYASSQV